MATSEAELSEVFARLEKSGFTSVNKIKSWLAGPNKESLPYTNAANMFAEPFGVRESVTQATTYDEVKDIQSSSKLMVVKDKTTLNQVNELVQSSNLSKKIEKRIGLTKTQKSLEKLKKETDKVTFRKNLIEEKIDIKIDESRRASGKLVTIYLNELKTADTNNEVDNILDRALDEIGEGKSYDTLVDIAGYKRDKIK